jgi:uncharacterized surface protein with fasciclin (FAS1) repeats
LFVTLFLGALGALSYNVLRMSKVGAWSEEKDPLWGELLASPFLGALAAGLLYDQAFGRVRRFGAQIFAADTRLRRESEDDISLANALKVAGASLAAQQVLTFGIGSRLAGEAEFTFLVPADPALEALSLQRWRKITDPATRSEFDKWFHHYHAPKRVMTGDVAGGSPQGSVSEVEADDGSVYSVTVEDGDLKFNDVKAVEKDIAWRNGVVHVLEREL